MPTTVLECSTHQHQETTTTSPFETLIERPVSNRKPASTKPSRWKRTVRRIHALKEEVKNLKEANVLLSDINRVNSRTLERVTQNQDIRHWGGKPDFEEFKEMLKRHECYGFLSIAERNPLISPSNWPFRALVDGRAAPIPIPRNFESPEGRVEGTNIISICALCLKGTCDYPLRLIIPLDAI